MSDEEMLGQWRKGQRRREIRQWLTLALGIAALLAFSAWWNSRESEADIRENCVALVAPVSVKGKRTPEQMLAVERCVYEHARIIEEAKKAR